VAKKVLSWVLSLLILLSITGCQKPADDQQIHTIEFSQKFLNIVQQTPEEWVEDLKVTAQGQLEDVYVSEAGDTVTLKLSDEHIPHWTGQMDSLLTQLRSDFSEIDENYRLEYSDDYKTVRLYYNLDLPALDAVSYVMHTETYCIFQQLLGGCGIDGWIVRIEIYNSDTGKLVASGGSESGLSYTKEDWEASQS
jgi:hypothetical protein